MCEVTEATSVVNQKEAVVVWSLLFIVGQEVHWQPPDHFLFGLEMKEHNGLS